MSRKLISARSPFEPVIGFASIDPEWLIETEADGAIAA
jgi:hypothetical protein